MHTRAAMDELEPGAPPVLRAVSWRTADLAPVIAVAAGYYLGALLGFWLRFPGSGISFFWPPTAVLTAAFLLNPTRNWGFLLVGAFGAHAAAHAQNGIPVAAWPIQFLANAVQAGVSAVLVRRFSDAARPFADLHRAVGYIVCAGIIGPGVASLIPAHLYVALGWSADALTAWRLRTVSNAIAALVLIPAILMIWPWFRSKPRPVAGWRITEFVLMLAALTLANASLRYVDQGNAVSLAQALYAPAPFLLWATVRFGGAGLSVALLCTTLLTVSTAFQDRALVGSTPGETIAGVQLFLATTAVPLILIAGLLEQNRAEHAALMEMERQNSATLRALPDLLFVQTRDGVYLKHFAPSRSQLLVPPEVFLGRNMRDILPLDLWTRFSAAFQTVGQDEASKVEYSLEIGGEQRRYESRFVALDGDRVLSVVRDITERQRSEDALREAQRRYALATAAGGIGVWEMDVRTGEVQVEGILPLLGYENGEVSSRLSDWYRLVCPADFAELRSRFTAFAEGTIPSFEAEYRMICKDGSTRWILSRGAIVDRVDGVITRLTGTYTDITDRREAEDALKHANDTMVRMGRVTALAELTASIAHELNQPLTAIATNANTCLRWLDSEGSGADLRGALRDLVADSRRAGQIVKRTREMFANRSVPKTPTDLNGVIRNVLDLARPRLRDAAVQLKLELEEQLPPIEADRVQVQQVAMNLIMNAVDAMLESDGRPRVLSVRSRRLDDDVLVTVRDTGPGFASPDAAQVFEPFYTTKADGVGIGLAISRSIVEAHGGSIWASADAGDGATFSFKLPVHAQTEAEDV